MNRKKKVKVVDSRLPTTQPVQVKLTPSERSFLDGLVRAHKYESRSAALRAGLGLLFDKHNMPTEIDAAIERERRRHAPRPHYQRSK